MKQTSFGRMRQRIAQFLKEVWAEVNPKDGKVIWPTQEQIINSTLVVLGLLAILTLFVAGIDVVAKFLFHDLLGLYPQTPTGGF
ncbi:MAG: preprotein translocase subunit SecE [Abditibacteriales bacterium]|nr:preprotein translocase subunit SecE [Abditibacteriales bacterium]MDW8365658.1 preprotein translocase subunit SecE [Abditibacteriales bacterium]